MANVYVAARNFELAEDTMELLREEGHVITVDWTKYPKGMRDKWAADFMIEGVRICDVLVLAGWDEQMLGALLEVGVAIGLHKPVILYGGNQRDSLFWTLDEIHFAEAYSTLVDTIADLT